MGRVFRSYCDGKWLKHRHETMVVTDSSEGKGLCCLSTDDGGTVRELCGAYNPAQACVFAYYD